MEVTAIIKVNAKSMKQADDICSTLTEMEVIHVRFFTRINIGCQDQKELALVNLLLQMYK